MARFKVGDTIRDKWGWTAKIVSISNNQYNLDDGYSTSIRFEDLFEKVEGKEDSV